MTTIAVKDATGATQNIEVPLASENNALLTTINTHLASIDTQANLTTPSPVELGPFVLKSVAASQSAAVLGATGAIGDYLYGVHLQPTSTTVGNVIILDGSTAVYTYPGGTVGADLRPIGIQLTAKCAGAGWHVTTGAGVTVTALGSFT